MTGSSSPHPPQLNDEADDDAGQRPPTDPTATPTPQAPQPRASSEVVGAPPTPEMIAPAVIALHDVAPVEDPTAHPRWHVFLWWLVQRLLVTNSLQPSSRLRAAALRAFGATIGRQVIIRPRVRVQLPWNLVIEDHCWIGEGVWISNKAQVTIHANAVVSQESFITTASHDRRTMQLVTSPVVLEEGCWITTRCVVLRGVRVGRSCIVTPNTVVDRDVPAGVIYGTPRPQVIGERF